MDSYSDIDQNINRFLMGKSSKNPFNFIPFQVQIVTKSPRQTGLSKLRSLYATAYSRKKSNPSYMNSIRTQKKQLSLPHYAVAANPKQIQSKKKLDRSVLLQHFYSRHYLEEQESQKTHQKFPQNKKKFSVMSQKNIDCRQSQDEQNDLLNSTADRFKNLLKTQPAIRVNDFLRSFRSNQNIGFSTHRQPFRTKRYERE